MTSPSLVPSVSTPDASEIVFLISADGEIRFSTPAAAHWYGCELDDIVGHSALRFVAPEEAESLTTWWRAFRDDPATQTATRQVTLLLSSGQRVSIRLSAWRLPGRPEFLIVHHVFDRLRDRLDALYAILTAVSGNLRLEEMLDIVLQEVHRLIACDTSTISIVIQNGAIRVRRGREGKMHEVRTLVQERTPEYETIRILRETGRPLLIDDCSTDPRWTVLPNHRTIGSWLGVPLIRHDEFFGELNLDSAQARAFTPQDADLMHALATLISAVLYNARQYEEQQRRARRFQALNDLHNAINHLDLASMLEVLYRRISSLMDTSSFYVALYDSEPGQVRLTGAYERGLPDPDVIQSADEGLTGRVLRTRQSLIIHNVEEEGLPDGAIITGEQPLSLALIPLLTQDEVVGVLSVQSYRPNAYTPDDLAMLEIMAGAIATAVRNAQLYDQTLSRLASLEMLHQLDLQLTNVQDPNTIAPLVIQAMQILFRPTEARVCLCNELPWPPQSWLAQGLEEPRSHECASCLTPPPGSLTEYVFQQGRPVIEGNLDNTPARQAEFEVAWPVRAVAAYPIQRGDHRFGMLMLLYDEPHFFRRDMLRTLELLCSQAAAALENARHTLAISRRLDEVSALQELARQVSASQSLDDILHTVVQTVRNIYQCKSASIALLDAQTQTVVVQASVGIDQRYLENARFEVGEYVAGLVVQTGQVIYVPDTYADPNFRRVDPGIRSMLTVPLTVQDRVIGTLSIDSAQPDAFTHEHERVLTIAGSQIAATIETVRRTAELAHANARLKAQDELRADLLIQVSHDLRSPLGLIQGYAGLMKEQAFGPVTPKQADILKMLETRSDSIKQLTEDILATKPIDRTMLSLIPLDITRFSEQAIHDARIVFAESGITFETDLAEGAFYVEADYHRLYRVYDNLISNAIKFSPNGGAVTLSTRYEPAHQRILVSIRDQGIGISEDKLPHIFERFFRGDRQFRERFKGTGVGLYNTRQIIEAHDGAIWVESQEGQGSTFTFALPLTPHYNPTR